MIKNLRTAAWGALAALALASTAPAAVLVTENVLLASGGANSCMINSDGTSWAGGAIGVQGATSTKMGGGSPLAANDTLKFSVGSIVDSLNATYGAGNWSIANAALSFQYTLYANNTRFGGGAGALDVYWVGKDSWAQGSSTPAFATTSATLLSWAGSQANLGSQTYSWSTPGYTGTAADASLPVWTTDKSGARQAILTYNLGLDPAFVSDITSASASLNPNVTLYLMSTSDSLGLTIFTGGGSSMPKLSFDVVSVPEPSMVALAALGLAAGFAVRRRK